jgi:hypothetical protein
VSSFILLLEEHKIIYFLTEAILKGGQISELREKQGNFGFLPFH